MTLSDWIDETRTRYCSQSTISATRDSARALLNGAMRHVGAHIARPIWHGDWDVLVVLDACRVDLMEEVIHEYDELPDHVATRWSNASCSIDWIERNFVNHPVRASITGYVTGNPFTDHDVPDARSADLGPDDVAYLARLYRTHWGEVEDGIQTISPEPVTDHTIEAWRQRESSDMQRIVAHYMQPHQPFRTHEGIPDAVGKNLRNLTNGDREQIPGACAWQLCRQGEIDRDDLWNAYRDNLRWVLNDVTERLLPNVDGTVVITADHGNAMGKWGEWAHPPGALTPEVRRVPWVTLDCTDTQTIEPDIEDNPAMEDATTERLEALGYVSATHD